MDNNSRIEALLEFLSENPADDFSEYALALEYLKSGKSDLAIYHLERILERNEEYLAAYYQCGKIHEASGNIGKATTCYEKGIRIAQRQKNSKTLNELRSALDMLN